MIQRAVPAVWDVMSPAAAIELRYQAVDRALRRLLSSHLVDSELAEAAQLARASIEGCEPGARVLYAAHTALAWPEEPHRMLWYACTLLREHRGDSHNIALAAAEINGVESHVLMAARGRGNKASILPIRGWTSEEWDDAVTRLAARGGLNADGSFTEQGQARRREVEAHTDRLANEPYQRLGPQPAQRLIDLMNPYVDRLHRGGVATQWPPPHLLRSVE